MTVHFGGLETGRATCMRAKRHWFVVLLAVLFVSVAACGGEPAEKKGKYRFDPTTAEWSAEETRGP